MGKFPYGDVKCYEELEYIGGGDDAEEFGIVEYGNHVDVIFNHDRDELVNGGIRRNTYWISCDNLDEELFHGFSVLGGADSLVSVRVSESEDIPFGNNPDEKRFGFGLGWEVEDGNVADLVFFHEREKIADSVIESQELDLSGHNIGSMAHGGQGDAEGSGDLVDQIETELGVYHVQFPI